VDVLGVAEPTLQRSGDARIIVELPGVTDPDEAVAVIGRTAQLTFHPVEGSSRTPTRHGRATNGGCPSGRRRGPGSTMPACRCRLGPSRAGRRHVGTAGIAVGPRGGFDVTVDFRGEGAGALAAADRRGGVRPTGRPAAAGRDRARRRDHLQPAGRPDVACGQGITGGSTSITGDFTQEEAEELSLLIRGGALPVPVEVVEQRTVGPTLGEAAIEASGARPR
jgi:SecD/SecF fusion protein